MPFHFGFGTGHEFHTRRNPRHVVRPQGTDVWILEYTEAGRALARDNGGTFYIDPGDFLLVPAEVPQDYGMDVRTGIWTHLWVCFHPRPAWHTGLLNWPRPTGYIGKLTLSDIALRDRLHERMKTAVTLGWGPLHHKEQFVLNIVEEILLWCETMNPLSEEACHDPRIREVVHYICAHISERVSVPQLADMCHLSPSRFAHLFQEQIGQTPMQYLEVQRIARARTLLLMSSNSIARIAESCGFPTHTYFSRIFKRHTGMLPQEFRTTGYRS